MEIARAARNHGVQKIHVSSILPRRGHKYRGVVERVNELLCMVCIAEEFLFMDQVDFTLAHIDTDGIHPNYYGSTILKNNILTVFNTFRPEYMDFHEDYDNALC